MVSQGPALPNLVYLKIPTLHTRLHFSLLALWSLLMLPFALQCSPVSSFGVLSPWNHSGLKRLQSFSETKVCSWKIPFVSALAMLKFSAGLKNVYVVICSFLSFLDIWNTSYFSRLLQLSNLKKII